MIVAVLLLTITPMGQVPEMRQPTRFRLLVPDEAYVFVAGQKMRSTGGERLFESPALRPGKRYVYEISVIHEGREVVRKARFEPGKLIELDFRGEFQKVTSAPPRPFKPIKPVWLPGRIWVA